MNRKYDTEVFKEKVALIREVFPNAGLTTDIIVGFPTETDQNHQETMDFVKEIKFSKTHLFKYSKRDGTKAADMKPEVDGNIKRKRLKELEIIEAKIRRNFLKEQIGKTLSVLFESKSDLEGFKSGYSTNYLRVNVKADLADNEIRDCLITEIKNEELIGVLL